MSSLANARKATLSHLAPRVIQSVPAGQIRDKKICWARLKPSDVEIDHTIFFLRGMDLNFQKIYTFVGLQSLD